VAGFEYGTSSNLASYSTVNASGTSGSISKDIAGLNIGTTYYFRIFATNEAGTKRGTIRNFTTLTGPCSGQTQVTNYDGNVYSLVEVGDQCWLGENLRSTAYSDGTTIAYRTISQEISKTSAQRWVYNDNPNSYLTPLGTQYNYTALYPVWTGSKQLCPAGYSIPTFAAFQEAVAYAEGLSARSALEELMSPTYWNGVSPLTEFDLTANGFRASQAGVGDSNGTIVPTTDLSFGWFSTSTANTGTPTGYTTSNYKMFTATSSGQSFSTSSSNFPGNGGGAVRCIKTSTDAGINP
jgi:uncharacterized protein (TIGR02145 family)